jgi:hypothetical protein
MKLIIVHLCILGESKAHLFKIILILTELHMSVLNSIFPFLNNHYKEVTLQRFSLQLTQRIKEFHDEMHSGEVNESRNKREDSEKY